MGKNFESVLHSEEFREEFFVSEIQARLAGMLDEKGISRAELARKLNVSRARVTQIFSDEASNFTLRLLVRSFAALDEEPVILTKREYAQLTTSGSAEQPAFPKAAVRQGSGDDLLPTQRIADLLRASDNEWSDHEKPNRRDLSKDWAEAAGNVIPFRRAVND